MIGKIKGQLTEVEGNIGLIETTSGVYYQVYLTNAILSQYIPPADLEIYTYLHVREDIMQLFGFASREEHKLFKMLLDVPGVGPKSAYGIISYGHINEIVTAIKANDAAYFRQIPGLGKKTALKIILELSNKFNSEFVFNDTFLTGEDKTVVEALTSLGFSAQSARKVFDSLPKGLELEEKISLSIKELSKTS